MKFYSRIIYSIFIFSLSWTQSALSADRNEEIPLAFTMGSLSCLQMHNMATAHKDLESGELIWETLREHEASEWPRELQIAFLWSGKVLTAFQNKYCQDDESNNGDEELREIEIRVKPLEVQEINELLNIWDNEQLGQMHLRIEWLKSEEHLGFPYPYFPHQEEGLTEEQMKMVRIVRAQITIIRRQMSLISLAREVGVALVLRED